MINARFAKRDNCRLCSSKKLEIVLKLAPIPLAEKYTTPGSDYAEEALYPVDLYMCGDCGHVQILDVIDSDRLWDDYTYHSGQTKGIVEHFENIAANITEKHRPRTGLVIDVGSNDGSLLRPFKARGHKVLGVDPAKEIARKATESGIETIPALMTAALAAEIREKHGLASVITAFNVYAHADDLNGMTASIRSMLAPDGIFVFEAQYLLDIVDKLLLGTIFHEHMSHHSLAPLVPFLDRHGLEIIDVERNTIQMGSIVGVTQPKGGPRRVSPAVAEMLALEKERGLEKPETVRELGTRLAGLRRKVDELVAGWKRSGASVAGYGAARSGPTLIVQFGLERVIEYILDDHPQKVDKLSPGHRMPVVATSELYTRKPDYVVILAWIHAKKIILNNQRYLDEGGRFVICCPEVRVIDKDNVSLLHER